MKNIIRAAAVIAALGLASTATAHTAWLVREGQTDSWLLRFGGHEGKLEPAAASKLRKVVAYDMRGKNVDLRRIVENDEVHINVDGEPAVIALYYNNGIHTRTAEPGPSIEKPMNEVPGGVSAVWAVKFGKSIVNWGQIARGSARQRFEVIPLSSEQPRAGQPMRVRVMQDGRPAAGVKIGRGEDNAEGTTDANGVASFTPGPGFNKLWAGKRIPQANNPRYTELSYEYLLTFNAS